MHGTEIVIDSADSFKVQLWYNYFAFPPPHIRALFPNHQAPPPLLPTRHTHKHQFLHTQALLLVRMPIFVTIGQRRQNFTCKNWQVGGKGKSPHKHHFYGVTSGFTGIFGSFSFPPPTSLKHELYGLTSGFTRFIMMTKYVCHGLISLHVNFHDNRTK